MNQEQLNSLAESCNVILSRADGVIPPGVDDSFYEVKTTEIPSLLKRVANGMLNAIQTGDARFFPLQFDAEATGQGRNVHIITTTMASLRTRVINRDMPYIVVNLQLAIVYQIFVGIWPSIKKSSDYSKRKRDQMFAQIENHSKQLEGTLADAKKMLASLDDEREMIKLWFEEVEGWRKRAQETLSQMQADYGVSSNLKGQIDQMVTDAKDRISDVDARANSAHAVLEGVKERIKVETEMADQIRVKIEWIEEKEDLVNAVTGTAAAGILGGKFEARKRELWFGAAIWLSATLAAVIASVSWVIWAHGYFKIPSDYETGWGVVFWNIGLALPGLFLISFAATQYLKERQFQEEYAFRASIAMSLKGLVDQIEKGSPERDQIIRDSIQRLYQTPGALAVKESRVGWVAARNAKALIKELAELMKEIKK